jgi:hypothetical protein
MQRELLFVTSNPNKVEEVQAILEPHRISVRGLDRKIEELQTDDGARLVRDKVLKAFKVVGQSVVRRAYRPVLGVPERLAGRSNAAVLGSPRSRPILRTLRKHS